MKRFALLFLLTAYPMLAGSGYPTIPVVQSLPSSSAACTLKKDVTSGNILIYTINWFGTDNAPTVSDTLTNTWTKMVDDHNEPNGLGTAVFTATSSSSGADTMTGSISGGSSITSNCSEHPPLFLPTTLDGSASVTYFSGTPATVTSGSITTTRTGGFLYGEIGGIRNATVFGPNNSDQIFLGYARNNDATGAGLRITGAPGSYTISFTNSGNDVGTMVGLVFKANSLSVTTTALPTGGLFASYDYTLQSAGAVASTTWSITSGALPAGLSLNASTGQITGTPTSGALSPITFQVNDGSSTATKALALKIVSSLSAISVLQTTSTTLSSGVLTNLAFGSNVTSGSLIVAIANPIVPTFSGNEMVKCTDTLSTPFLPVGNGNAPSQFGNMQMLVGIASSGGADTVNCDSLVGIAEIANAQAFGDNFNFTTGNTASPITSSSLTTLVPNQILVALAMGNTVATVMTPSSPFTAFGGSATNYKSSYDIKTTVTGYTVTYTFTGNTDGHWAIILQGFRPNSSAAPLAPASTGFPMVIKYRQNRGYKIPWDNRKRKLQIVSI